MNTAASDLPGLAFLDFEASSLGKHGYPIEVAWVLAGGEEESHLIRPAPAWTDWSQEAQAIHGIPRERLMAEGKPVDEVARRMVAVLNGQALYATAPSWDGQWLSTAGLPRHTLRLQDTDVAHRQAVVEVLQAADVPAHCHEGIFQEILAEARRRDDEAGPPTHRALADAQRELQLWHDVRRRAEEIAARSGRQA